MQNDLQKWLRHVSSSSVSGDLDIMLNAMGVYRKRHPKYPNLVQFCYDQIESYAFRTLPVTKISRGIILNEADNWEVVCYPFNRFFNIGEGAAAEIDPKTMRVYEKVDGSLCCLYWYDNQWHVCTRNSPDAGGNVFDEEYTFAQLFWNTFNLNGFSTSELEPWLTYMFELTAPENMVVVSHTEYKLTLLGARHNQAQQEITPNSFPHLNPVKEFRLTSFDDVIKASEQLDPLQQEGYVICDANFNRIKVKSPKYVALHHMVSDFSVKNCINLILLGEESELFAYYPQYENKYFAIKKKFEDYIEKVEDDWYSIHQLGDIFTQREFAEKALKTTDSGALFAVRKGSFPNVRAAIMARSAEKIMELINVR
jgi:hypothetical protein